MSSAGSVTVHASGEARDRSGERLGRYELLERLASGGMAEIYKARLLGPEHFCKPLALKLIRPERNNAQFVVDMFIEEARFAARLNHPNIAQVFELGSDHRCFFLAMELVEGPDLAHLRRHLIEAGRKIPVMLACHVMARVAEGLHFAHEQVDPDTGLPLGIVHRDVSPQNVIISRFGEVKVVDFGVAFAKHFEFKTGAARNAGKAAYMSPEQRRGESVDRRTDVFAAGVVLYELLTMRSLFHSTPSGEPASDPGDVLPPSAINGLVPPELDAIVMRALEPDRNRRYSSAEELSDALDGWVANQRCVNPRAALAAWIGGLAGALEARTLGAQPKRPEPAPSDTSCVAEPTPLLTGDDGVPIDLESIVELAEVPTRDCRPAIAEIEEDTDFDPAAGQAIENQHALEIEAADPSLRNVEDVRSALKQQLCEFLDSAPPRTEEDMRGALKQQLFEFLNAASPSSDGFTRTPPIQIEALPSCEDVAPAEERTPPPFVPIIRGTPVEPSMPIIRGTPVVAIAEARHGSAATALSRVWRLLCRALAEARGLLGARPGWARRRRPRPLAST